MERKLNEKFALWGIILGAVGAAIAALLTLLPVSWTLRVGVIFFVFAMLWLQGLITCEQRERRLSLSTNISVMRSIAAALALAIGLLAMGANALMTRPGSSNLILLMDDSGSMSRSDPDGSRKTSTKEWLNSLSDNTNVAFLPFSEGVDAAKATSLQPLNREYRQELEEHIDALASNGRSTNIGLALNTAVMEAEGKDCMILMFTDGLSDYKPSEIVNNLQEVSPRTSISIIQFIPSSDDSASSIPIDENFKTLTSATGGTVMFIDDMDQLAASFASSMSSYLFDGDEVMRTLRLCLFALLGLLLGMAAYLTFGMHRFLRWQLPVSAAMGLLAGWMLGGMQAWPDAIKVPLAMLPLSVLLTPYAIRREPPAAAPKLFDA
ncbi:MAG: VWA domain-containing protein [Oscillospiraceae bacterium]|nr:VWA domain-containing protein [Oscillospiraceae bacterium]